MQKNYKKITNVNHVRQIVSQVINQLMNDEIDNQTAQAIGTLCSLQLKVIKAVDLDKRIKRLEEGEDMSDATPVVSDIRAKIKSIGG